MDNLEQQRDTPGRGSSSSSNVLESNPRRSSSVSNSGTPNRYSNQLGTSSNQLGSSTRPGNQSGSSSTRPGNQSGSSSNRPGSISNAAQLEFNRLFSWNPKSSVGSKRKKGSNQKGGGSKKRLPTWTHTFVCLANTDDNTAPESKYRASLQLAGLWEKRLSVDLYADTEGNCTTTSCSTSLSLSMLADTNCCDRVQLGQARNWRSFHSREMGTQWSTLRRWYIRQKCSSGPCGRTWSYPQTGLTNRLAAPIQALEILLQKKYISSSSQFSKMRLVVNL